ncbi:glycosyltransferase family 4 protein [Corallibacter sp.]|uniref:glycosyltransferase family 4 protein n=1 Tax=Corallibacter sp. TaxID=2038084 RepID=UPI003A8DFDBD
MNKKSVWLINQYLCTPELNNDGHRHSFLAEEFIKKGYDVTLITSSFSHVPYRENNFKGLYKVIDKNIRTLLIKGNKYKGTQGFARVFSWLIFCFLLFFIPTKKIPKPDIIIVSSNSLLPILNVVFFFKRKFKGVKFILEIRDIWPLSLIELGGFSSKNILIRFLAWVEKLGYKKADHIVSLLMNADVHIKNVLGHVPFKYTWISNGFQIEDESTYKPISKELAALIPKDGFIVGYAGSLGKANAMEYIIEGFNKIKNKNIHLLIVGSGDEMISLKKLSISNNISFLGRLPKNEILSFLNKCDLLYFSSKDLKIYSYGISANKTFDYMYAAKPILLSASTQNNVIQLAKCGKVIKPNDSDLIVEEILNFKEMSLEDRKTIGLKGKDYLLKYFTYDKLSDKYIDIFKSLS